MTQINYIRNLYYNEGKSKAEISRITKVDVKTIRKYIEKEDFNSKIVKPHNYGVSILDPFKEIIDKWIVEDKIMRKKQRHTATKVYSRLCKEHSYKGCYRTVTDYFKARKQDIWNQSSSSLPLLHSAGEMQVDFGAIQFWNKSELVDGFSLNVTFPFSNAGYIQIFRGQNQQCLFEGLINIFRHINGIPKRIWFDNMSTAVKRVSRGKERDLTDEFSRFKNHFNFDTAFCNPASGNEKGSVENKVGYLRRNLLVPAPIVDNIKSFNKRLLNMCDEDLNREHYIKGTLICDLHKLDKDNLLNLPLTEFDSSLIKILKADKCGRFILESKFRYSSAPKFAGENLRIKIGATDIIVLDSNLKEIVTHDRLYGDLPSELINWLPYLTQLSRYPRAIKYSGIYELFPLKISEQLKELNEEKEKQIFRFMAEVTEDKGFEKALQITEECLDKNISSLDNMKMYLKSRLDKYPKVEKLRLNNNQPAVKEVSPNIGVYDALLTVNRRGN